MFYRVTDDVPSTGLVVVIGSRQDVRDALPLIFPEHLGFELYICYHQRVWTLERWCERTGQSAGSGGVIWDAGGGDGARSGGDGSVASCAHAVS